MCAGSSATHRLSSWVTEAELQRPAISPGSNVSAEWLIPIFISR